MKPLDELGAAIEAERAAWLAVKDHLPGAEGHDPRAWEAWLAAMRHCQDVRATAWAGPHDGNAAPPAAVAR
jgi:hypothetical protein